MGLIQFYFVDCFNFFRKFSLLVSGLFFIAICLQAFPASAVEEKGNLQDLDSCVNLALRHAPELKISELEVEYAQSKYSLEKSRSKPSLSLDSNIGYVNGQIVGAVGVVTSRSDFNPLQDREYVNSALILNIPLFSEGSLLGFPTFHEQSALHNVSAAEWTDKFKQLQTKVVVVEIYFNLLKSKRAMEAYGTILEYTDVIYEESKAKFKQNLISKNELLTAQMKLEHTRISLTNAVLDYEKNKKNLSILIGLGENYFHIQNYMTTDVEIPPLDEISKTLFEDNPLIEAQISAIEAVETEVLLAKGNKLPTLDIVAKYGAGTDMQGNSDDGTYINLKLTYDIFNFGQESSKEFQAERRLSIEKQKLQVLKNALHKNLVSLYYEFKQIRDKIKFYDLSIAQTHEKLAHDMAKKEQELLSVIDVKESEIILETLLLEKEQLYYELMIAKHELQWLYKVSFFSQRS